MFKFVMISHCKIKFLVIDTIEQLSPLVQRLRFDVLAYLEVFIY